MRSVMLLIHSSITIWAKRSIAKMPMALSVVCCMVPGVMVPISTPLIEPVNLKSPPIDERQLEFPLTTIRIPVFGDDLDSPSISFSGGLDGHRQTIQEAYEIYSRRGF